ncbi:MAG: ATP-binding protein [Acidobacteriota bacterium]|nr:ATP-binding protein [Acidobacteriota bacterium]
MRERFVLDAAANILFIDFSMLRIESREQVEELARLVREAVEGQGRRVYSVVNYEGTEIAPEIVEYYGERIRELQARYALTTVRYSSSGLTRSVLRYLGAAVDLESNIFTTREEAIRAIQELERRRPASRQRSRFSAGKIFSPRQSLIGKLLMGWLLVWLSMWLLLAIADVSGVLSESSALSRFMPAVVASSLTLLAGTVVTSLILFFSVIKPLRKMEAAARSFATNEAFEPVADSRDEVGQLARVLNDAASQLRRDIERLSGLYHISLMMGTGTEVSRICELLTRKVARLLGAEMCVILLYDEREQRLHAQLPAYGVSDEHVRFLRANLDEKSIATWVFQSGEPYLTNDVAADPLISRVAAEMLGAHSALAVPLRAGERGLGTLEVMNKEGGFVEEDKRLVTIFAAQAAHLLVNAQLFEEVRESEERYRQIFESTPDGLYRSTPDGQLVTVNPALAVMLGYEGTGELTGANFAGLFVDAAASSQLIDELNEHGRVIDVECELRRNSGETLPTRISVRAITDKADQAVYHLGIVRDVTEQRRLAEQLKVSEQLAVVGELVAGVAHEMRNPLCGITTTLSALAKRLDEREAVRPFLEVVLIEAGRLNHLMEQLLEHSRPARPDGKPADIGQLLREVVGEWRAQAESAGVALAVECPTVVPGLRLDGRKMHGVFVNLLDNALQHTAPGGEIRVRLIAPNSHNGERNHQPAISIEVSDTGAGVAPDQLPKIFEPFFTTRAAGTGLGLAIVRKSVHDHGGTITARSELGKGTAFTISLPLDAYEHAEQ